jgi:hypothetical protein
VYAQGDDSDSVYVVFKGQCSVTTMVTASGVPPPQPEGGAVNKFGAGGAGKSGAGGGNKKKGIGVGGGGGGLLGGDKGGPDAAAVGGMSAAYRVETSHLPTFGQPKRHQVALTVIGEGNMFGGGGCITLLRMQLSLTHSA